MDDYLKNINGQAERKAKSTGEATWAKEKEPTAAERTAESPLGKALAAKHRLPSERDR